MTPLPPSFTCPIVIGRDREIGLLRAWLEDREQRIAVLSGEAGIGKTRLVRETVTLASRLGYRIVQTGSLEPDRAEPYAPLVELLRQIAATSATDDLTRWAGSDATALAWLVPELAATGGQPGTRAERPQRRRLFEAAARFLSTVHASTPLLVVIEDLHWTDEGSLDFLLYLAHRLPLPGRLLLTYRRDDVNASLSHLLAGLDRERCAIELALAGLGPHDVETMLHAILDRGPVPAEALHLVWTLTDGNPFFVEELLKTLATNEPAVANQINLRSIDQLQVPRSVQDAVTRRTAQLSRPARHVLDIAAVTGRYFDYPLLWELTGTSETALLAAIKELVSAQLVVEESADRFAFRHALTRRAIYAGLLTRERRELHRAIAGIIGQVHADHLDDYVTELADHWFEAGIWDEAVHYARLAGERAQTLDVPAVAVHHLSRALAAAQHLASPSLALLHRKRGQAFETLGEFDRALADYEQALELVQAAGDRTEENAVLLDLGLLWAGRDYQRTGIYVKQALQVARALRDPALTAHGLNRLGNWLANVEEPEQALVQHREALTIFEDLADRHGIAETLDLLGIASFFAGDRLGGINHYEQAVVHWREIENRRGLASSLVMLVARGPNFHTGTLPDAIPLTEAERTGTEGLEITRTIGWRAGEAWARWELGGLCLAAQGNYGRALEETRAARALAEEIEHRQWMVGADCMLGCIYADLLAWPLARHHLGRALSLAREIASPYWIRSAAAWLASAAIAQGDLIAAEEILTLDLRPDTTVRTVAGRLLWAARAELALVQGEPATALAIIDHLIRSAPAASSRHPSAYLAKLRGEALAGLDRTEESEAALRAARAEAVRLGWRPMVWHIDLARGWFLRAQRRRAEADQAFAAARQFVEVLAATVPDEALRTTFLTGAAALFPSPPSSRRAAKQAAGGLTERERDVVRLLACGMSNRDIATTLFISEWTVATHVRNILAKLDLHSRTQVGAWAREHGRGDGQ